MPKVAQRWLRVGSKHGRGWDNRAADRLKLGKVAENGQKRPSPTGFRGLPKGHFRAFFAEVASRCLARPFDLGVYRGTMQHESEKLEYQVLIPTVIQRDGLVRPWFSH